MNLDSCEVVPQWILALQKVTVASFQQKETEGLKLGFLRTVTVLQQHLEKMVTGWIVEKKETSVAVPGPRNLLVFAVMAGFWVMAETWVTAFQSQAVQTQSLQVMAVCCFVQHTILDALGTVPLGQTVPELWLP